MVGALSIEAAAKHLSARDIDGIVLGEGFSLRVIDAFLTVLAEDARFRNLPVVVTSNELRPLTICRTSKSSPAIRPPSWQPRCHWSATVPLRRI